jgi:tRNA acetyltransferase TAN1
LRALGDPAPITVPTLSKGILGARTALDSRDVVRDLRILCQASPEAFRQTTRWVPIDVWTAPNLVAIREAAITLASRIGPQETWRITVQRRAGTALSREEIIRSLAPLISAAVNLAHPDKVLLTELFGDSVALALLAPDEILSVATVPARRQHPGGAGGGGDQR